MPAHKIVGSWYRPPAGAILAVLPLGTKLTVRPEPDNPVDKNAIAVWVDTHDISHNETTRARLLEPLANCGLTLSDVYEKDSHHLGYIPAIEAKKIKLPAPIAAQLAFLPNGAPQVQWAEYSGARNIEMMEIPE